jgi:hypothetical protein
MKKQDIEEMERQDADGYSRIPSDVSEFEEWESEQVWAEYEEGKPAEGIQQATTAGATKAMDEAFIRPYLYEIFAEIRKRSSSKKGAPKASNVLAMNSSLEAQGVRSHYRSIVFTMLVVAAAMLVWPPWKVGTGGRAIGYHLFFRSNPAGYASAYLDWSRLGLQFLILLVLVAAVMVLWKNKKQ